MEQKTALLGAYIRLLREARGWSLRDLANAAGISHTTVDNIERGYDPRTGRVTNITLDTLGHLAEALDETPSRLFSCLDGSVEVKLRRPVDSWYEDEREDLAHARDGVAQYLLLKWGKGELIFPSREASGMDTKRALFGGRMPTDAEWEQVVNFAKFLSSK